MGAGCYKAPQFSGNLEPCGLLIDFADISLTGAREENQDRVTAAIAEHAALLVAIDGMGGHAAGAHAAETAIKVLVDTFWQTPQPLFDPLGFLHLTLGRAHDEVAKLAPDLPMEHRPRATCAVCLVQGHAAYWAHVGDSRVYHLRGGAVVARTRDHSHVEFLLREGVISEEQALMHPMRNYVEACVGGESILPEMTLGARAALQPNDTLLVCTDGFWGGLRDEDIAQGLAPSAGAVRDALERLAERAVDSTGVASDNTSVAALRWMGLP